ncbi:hypothetical protein K437DRAFT_64928 [Tilletiaria anomala UBC 951]|uniref:Uncharacterized protein n=1 Tax=Tilletiaria anomala (strain ATCC 24038 / CBS 436.72 / UBC 951) TaxID=1037660 RepID=A0A066WH49_TILAU|nr:uncharacterized protein K437DRAFT_64928 [Tilletiaria anomala UBC 951]KDN50349.1 hypothetical protein K437DRAFT_64928 [Tilletiaria anomala UBC 951]
MPAQKSRSHAQRNVKATMQAARRTSTLQKVIFLPIAKFNSHQKNSLRRQGSLHMYAL